MAVFNEPSKWQTSLVNSGDANTIPQNTPAGSGEASFEEGFPQITQVPIGAGGQAPNRKDFNGLFKILGDSIFYMQNGGLWSYNSAFDYAVGRVVLYTDGNLYKCIQANTSADPKDPTDSDYWSKIPVLSDFNEIGFNTGDIKPLTSNNIPSSWLLGNGATVNRSICPNLVQFAYDNDLVRDSTEQASYESDPDKFTGRIYGAGDGSTTIQIPNLRGRSLMGALASTSVGRYVPEQLPNITGDLVSSTWSNFVNSTDWTNPYDASKSGAVEDYGYPNTKTKKTSLNGGGAGSLDVIQGSIDASRLSSVYTNNGKVYPASIALNFIIKT